MANFLVFIEVIILVGLSAVCSGLNVGLVSLSEKELQRKSTLGNTAAKRVLPYRKNLHLTLAGILITNVAVISGTSLVLNNRFNGVIAEIASTLLIVIFGEIVPQSFFAQNALSYCSKLTPLLKLMVIVTYPISKPLQILLDDVFKNKPQGLTSRRELGLLISEHTKSNKSELDDDEIEIMRGALKLSEKRVRDIMVQLRKVYWITPETEVNETKLDEIKERGWSRIPVFNKSCTTCFGVILMKNLVDIDFDEHPQKVEELTLYPTQIVGSMTALDTLFRKFISSGSHLFPVEQGDKIIGIVTFEDLLEEIVGHEIEDEIDRSKRRGE